MALSRREAFIQKVLKRLYPETSSSPVHTSSREEKAPCRNLGSKSEEKNLDNVQTSSADANVSTDTPCKSFQGADNRVLSSRKMYTVNLPPEGYVAITTDANSNSVSENSSHSADSTDEEYQGQTKRKRIRRKKQKNSLQNSNNLHGEQTESGMQETLVQDNIQLQQTDSPKISKNKKRKLKKKRQKEKRRAAGLVTKTTSVDFTYQPDKSNREEAAGLKDIDEKADSILDFLQATQQIYFTDRKSKCMDSAVNSATTQELLQCLEFHTISSSDLTLLHRLKSLILLQDVERLKDALKQFQEQSMMPPGAENLRLRNHGYNSPENDTWVYKVVTASAVDSALLLCQVARGNPIKVTKINELQMKEKSDQKYSSCRKNHYQLIRHTAAPGSAAAGHVWDQYIQLQHTPANSTEEASLDPLSSAGTRPEE